MPPHGQGNLDVKYLADRYQRGLGKVQDYMAGHQRYIELRDLNDGLPVFLQHVQQNASEFLGFLFPIIAI